MHNRTEEVHSDKKKPFEKPENLATKCFILFLRKKNFFKVVTFLLHFFTYTLSSFLFCYGAHHWTISILICFSIFQSRAKWTQLFGLDSCIVRVRFCECVCVFIYMCVCVWMWERYSVCVSVCDGGAGTLLGGSKRRHPIILPMFFLSSNNIFCWNFAFEGISLLNNICFGNLRFEESIIWKKRWSQKENAQWFRVIPGTLSLGILRIPRIAGYKWVPARLAHFYKNKILFLFYQWPIKNRKNRYSIVCWTFPCQYSLA